MTLNQLINENTYIISDTHFGDYRMEEYEPSRVEFAQSLNLNIDIKEKVNSLEKITFGAALVQFAKSIDKDIQLIPSITIDEDSLTQDIIEYMNSPKNNTVEDPKK